MFSNGYPYTDLHELNLDWIISKMRDLEIAMETFKATESLKFADPIIWDITTQYEKSTVVLDPSGNAYLSLQPVPVGIQLNNNDYWLEIFNFTDYTRTANQNLTVNVETNTTRATSAYSVDDWLIWNDVLYKVTSAIAIDDALVVGTNLVHFTVEDFIKAWITYANGLIQQYKNDIDASEIAYRQQLAQDIADTTASLQAQLNLAISGATVDSEVINARLGADGITYSTLGDAIRSQMINVYGDRTQINDLLASQINYSNLYNKDSEYIVDNYLITGTGVVSSNSDYSYIKIPVIGGRTYSHNKRIFVCYYSKGAVISGGGDYTTPMVRTIPSTADYMSISVHNDNKASLRVCYSTTLKKNFEAFGKGEPTEDLDIYNKTTVDQLFNLFNLGTQNLVDKFKVTNGYFIVTTGQVQSNAAWCYIVIPVTAGNDYSISGGRHITCYYNGDSVVSGGQDSYNNEVITIPSGVDRIAISIQLTNLENLFVTESSSIITKDEVLTDPSSWLNVYNKNEVDQITGFNVNVINVTSSDNLRTVIEGITDSSKTNKYIVAIEEGTYDISSYYTATEIADANFKGLVVPNYVKLMGVGNRENIVLSWNNTGADLNKVATLNLKVFSELENLRIESSKIRYAVHDEYVNYPTAIPDTQTEFSNVINCHLIADNDTIGSSVGIGVGSGQRREYKDCLFEVVNKTSACVYMHNHLNFTQSAYLKFVNCIFNTEGTKAMAIRSLTNGTHIYNYAELIGNNFNGLGLIVGPDDVGSYGDGNLFKVEGYANTSTTVTFDNTDGIDYSGDVTLH